MKGYGFLFFAKNVGKDIGNGISINTSSKHFEIFLDHAKKSATDAIKTASKSAIRKSADIPSDFIGNKIADKITKVSRTSPQDTSETVTSKAKYIYIYIYIYPEKKKKDYW